MLIHAFDCEKSQCLWGNLGYNGQKIHLKQAFSEKALEWKENEAGYMASDIVEIRGTFEQHYDQWKDVVMLERPLIFRDTRTAYTVVDDLLPKEFKKPLDFRTFLCVARMPTISAARFNTAPDFPRKRRQDRFNQEALDPSVEGNLTRWRYAAIQGVPEVTCPRYRSIFLEGMLI